MIFFWQPFSSYAREFHVSELQQEPCRLCSKHDRMRSILEDGRK